MPVIILLHLRGPVQYKSLQTGTMAAVKGGLTTVCCMPNTLPVNDNARYGIIKKSFRKAALFLSAPSQRQKGGTRRVER
jgi:dihydroorotase